jgi:hypothetical protein
MGKLPNQQRMLEGDLGRASSVQNSGSHQSRFE